MKFFAPPPPLFLTRRHFSGEGGGDVYFEPPLPGPLLYTPTLGGYFQGVGGRACMKFGPVSRQKGDSKREKPDPERTFSQIFADFRWFSACTVKQGIWESQICTENRRKPQNFLGNRRFFADFCRNRFLPFAVSLLARSYFWPSLSSGERTQWVPLSLLFLWSCDLKSLSDCDLAIWRLRGLKSCLRWNPTTIRHDNITYPKKNLRIIFRLPFHDSDFFELILENYPIPIAFVWVVRHYPVGTPVLVELFFITVTRFEFFRVNWVMFSWQMVVTVY